MQRKSDIARLKAAYQHCKANNKGGVNLSAGNYVENFNNFMSTYMYANGEDFKDLAVQITISQKALKGY